MSRPPRRPAAAVAVVLLAWSAGIAAAGETVVFRIASEHPPQLLAIVHQAVARFEQQHSGLRVHIEYRPAPPEQLAMELFAGRRPGVISVPLWVGVELAARGAVALPEPLRNAAAQRIHGDLWRACRTGEAGEPAGLPWLADTVQLITNSGLVGETPLTLGELEITCRRLAGKGRPGFHPIGFAARPHEAFRPFAVMLCLKEEDGRFFDRIFDDAAPIPPSNANRFYGIDPSTGNWVAKVNLPSGQAALADLRGLMRFAPADSHRTSRKELAERFSRGEVAMFFGSVRDLGRIPPGMANVRTVPVPVGSAGASLADIWLLVLPKPSPPDGPAVRLAEFLVGDETQRLVMTGGGSGRPRYLPVLRHLAEDAWYRRNPQYRAFVRGLDDCRPAVPTGSWRRIADRVAGPMISRVFAGQAADYAKPLVQAELAANHVLSTAHDQMTYPGWTRVLGWVVGVLLFFAMVFAIGRCD